MLTKAEVKLSCVQCQQRKRKCDRQIPCQTCLRAGTECTPVKRHRLPRGRHALRTDEELRQRVTRLETLLSQQEFQSTGSTPDAIPAQCPVPVPNLRDAQKEVTNIRDLLDEFISDERDDGIQDAPALDPDPDPDLSFNLLLFGNASCLISPEVLEPVPLSVVAVLLDVYLYRVDKVFKVTHESVLRKAMLEENHLSTAYDAMKLATMFTAVTSLDAQECLQLFNAEKVSLSKRFRLAAEVRLSQADLLVTTDLLVLQAFVIYLVLIALLNPGLC